MSFFYPEKVSLPELKKDVLHGNTLDAIVGVGAVVSWICAPAGFGKSVLLRQVADCHMGQHFWYNIEQIDNDPALFFSILKQSVCAAHPAAHNDVPDITADALMHLDAFVPRFFAALAAVCRQPVLLVLDNYDRLDTAARLHGLLAVLVARMPSDASVRLLIGSRDRPPATWQSAAVEDRLRIWDTSALTVNESAAMQCLRGTRWEGRQDIAQWLVEQSGGWVAGIWLLIDYLRRSQVSELSAADDHIPVNDREALFKFFATELFSTLDVSTQRVLLTTSFLPFVPERLLGQISRIEGATELLGQLDSQQFFLSRLRKDESGEIVYVCHDLLRMYLQDEFVRRCDSIERREVMFNAAIVLHDSGWRAESMALFVELGEWRSCVAYIEENAAALVAAGRSATLLSLYQELPDALRLSTAELQFWYGICLPAVSLSESRLTLEGAYRRFKYAGNIAGMAQSWAAIQDMLWIDWRDSVAYDQWIDELADLKVAIDSSEQKALAPLLAKGAFLALTRRQMDHPELPYWEQQNFDLLESGLSQYDAFMRCAQMLLHYTWGVGDRARAAEVFASLTAIYRDEYSSTVMKCVFHVAAGAYKLWFSSSQESATQLVETGLVVAEQSGWHSVDVSLINIAVFAAAGHADEQAIERGIAQLAMRLDDDSRPNDVSLYHSCQAMLAWQRADNDQALALVTKAVDIALAGGHSFTPIYSQIGVARVMATMGDTAAAHALLSTVRKYSVRCRSDSMLYLALLVGADIVCEAGHSARAMKYFNKAMEIATRQRYFMMIWVRVENIRAMLRTAISEQPGNAYLVERLASLSEAGPVAEQAVANSSVEMID